MEKEDSLDERVLQFMQMKLPGQPMCMHMGTSYLVNDLWYEVQQLRNLLRDVKKWLSDHEEDMFDGGLSCPDDLVERIRATLENKS